MLFCARTPPLILLGPMEFLSNFFDATVMFMFFAIAAAIGCTVMLFQFVMSFFGLAGDAFDADIGADFDVDGEAGSHFSSSQLFAMISVRTVSAFLAFFGLAGLGTTAFKMSPLWSVLIAVGVGSAAFFISYLIFKWISLAQSDGSLQMKGAIGKSAKVSVAIPANSEGAGKIQVSMQEQLAEFSAQTEGEKIESGTVVTVEKILAQNTVQVRKA